MDRPVKVANPARGQANRKNGYFPVPVRAREFDLARQVQPSRPASACSFSTLRLTLVLTRFLPISAAASIYVFIPPTTIGSVPSSSSHAFTYRWRQLPRVCRHRTSSPQGSPSNGCCLFRYHHGPIIVPLFSYIHYWSVVDMLMLMLMLMCDKESNGGGRYALSNW